jgi:U3 small nucleolar RNA-associated protein 21
MEDGQDDFALPPPKRQRVDSRFEPTASHIGSRLFSQFRTLGLVSPTTVPFTSVGLGKTTFQITTSVGRSLQTYDLRRGLQLVFISRPHCPDRITATSAYRDRVLVAWGGANARPCGVWVFKRGKLVDALEEANLNQSIEQILVFGNWIVGTTANTLEVWKSDSYEHYASISSTSPTGSRAFCGRICILPTYLNKVFVGRQDGGIEIYNISTAKLVHTIHSPSASSGPVTALAPAMAVCVVAVAYADGSLYCYDADTDEAILSLKNRSGKPITSIAFRADGIGAGEDGRQDGALATASIEDGDITLWDLNRGAKVAGVVRGAHETSTSSRASGITKIEFLPGQPVLISSGLDNAIRSWVFDQSPFSPIPRILHARSGHAAPVTELMFLPAAADGSEAAGKWILSGGRDRSLWGFSLRKDSQNTELSQGNVQRKAKKAGLLSNDRPAVEELRAPPIVDMACCLNRDGGMGSVSGQVWSNTKNVNAEVSSMSGWESVVTAHAEDKFARTWSWGRKKAGRWAFETGDQKPATSVAMTACGTFALVGSAGGCIDMYNLQSGMHRQRFPPRIKPAQAKQLNNQQYDANDLLESMKGHRNAITGIVVDSLNETTVSSSLDGTVIFWDFSTGRVAHRLALEPAAGLSMKYNSVSGLIAISCDDLCIRIIDIEARRIVRELWGCVGQINDLCFSHDGRWIVACSMDSVIRVFDLATGHLIDAFRTATCTNVAFSSTGEYLATTHAGALGINIWTNKSIFTYVAPHQIDEDTGIIDLTSSDVFEPTNQITIDEDSAPLNDAQNSAVDTTSEIDQLDASLLTLSLLPRSRWQTLLNLDTIRQRNKPIQPPEKPKAAPFFLGSSLAISNPKELVNSSHSTPSNPSSRITTLSALPSTSNQTSLSTLLTIPLPTPQNPTTPHPLIPHLTALSPSTAHLSIQTLPLPLLPPLIRILTSHLRTHRDSYELLNTYMSLILKLHADFLSVDDVHDAVVEWQQANAEESRRLDGMVGYVGGVVGGWLRSSR